jgi:hypothetical protein
MSIKIEVDGVPIQDILVAQDDKITYLSQVMDDIAKCVTTQNTLIDQQKSTISDLKDTIIEMKNEDTKERRSLWDYLTGNNKKSEPKKSRITESTVTLDK